MKSGSDYSIRFKAEELALEILNSNCLINQEVVDGLNQYVDGRIDAEMVSSAYPTKDGSKLMVGYTNILSDAEHYFDLENVIVETYGKDKQALKKVRDIMLGMINRFDEMLEK